MTLKEAVDKMRGPAKTHVAITVQRGDLKDAKVFDIVREIIHVQPVRSRVEGGDIGYIRITQFNEQTYDALKAAIAKLHASGAEDPRLRPRFAQQSGRPAVAVDPRRQQLHRFRRDRLDARAHGRPLSGIQRPARLQPERRQADGGADQRRLGFGLGDRLRRACRI